MRSYSRFLVGTKGFTLVEMLTVVSIAAILAVLSVPALQGLQQAGGFDKSVYALSDSLNFARSYAVANNTYVYVGITELDRTQNLSASPQNPGTGRVALSIVATKDGTSDVGSWSGNNLTQVRQIQTFDFFHIASYATSFMTSTTSGAMSLPTNIVASSVSLLPMPAATTPGTPFSFPLSGSGKYNFSNTSTDIVCFNPQGGVLLNGTAVQRLEIDVQPMSGNITPIAPANVNQGNQAAMVIDGLTGAVTVYRP